MVAVPLTQGPAGVLLLEDGREFPGRFAGHAPAVGELVFTTNMTGYQEVLTDPSFAGQIVVMTAPMMGNYGVSPADVQSRRPWVAGFVVRELSGAAHSWRADGSLRDYLGERGIAVLEGVDTRAVTRHIRSLGAMRAVIAPAGIDRDAARELLLAEPAMLGRNLATEVSTEEAYVVEPNRRDGGSGAEAANGRGPEREVVCLDLGVKRRSLELIAAEGLRVRAVPGSWTASDMLALGPSGLFVSNGPGDPEAVPAAPAVIRAVAHAGVPVFGICLGCQLVARAWGGRTYKLPYGHRGGNHPVRNLETGVIEITSQNHGFAVVEEGGEDVEAGDERARAVAGAPDLLVTHRNLNDGTIEGLRHRTKPVFAVQYHPEAAPGPHDSRYLFERFIEAMNATSIVASG